MYKTKITSQGTITLPSALRRKYDLRVGEVVTIEDAGKIVISKSPDFATLRQKNKPFVKGAAPYHTGDGMVAHIKEKYAK